MPTYKILIFSLKFVLQSNLFALKTPSGKCNSIFGHFTHWPPTMSNNVCHDMDSLSTV